MCRIPSQSNDRARGGSSTWINLFRRNIFFRRCADPSPPQIAVYTRNVEMELLRTYATTPPLGCCICFGGAEIDTRRGIPRFRCWEGERLINRKSDAAVPKNGPSLRSRRAGGQFLVRRVGASIVQATPPNYHRN